MLCVVGFRPAGGSTRRPC